MIDLLVFFTPVSADGGGGILGGDRKPDIDQRDPLFLCEQMRLKFSAGNSVIVCDDGDLGEQFQSVFSQIGKDLFLGDIADVGLKKGQRLGALVRQGQIGRAS